ncbi:hypothetical protein JCM14467A_14900 [Vulcanisaeta sp. JCM 14467]
MVGGLGCLVDGVRLSFWGGSWVLSLCGDSEVVEGSITSPPFEIASNKYLGALTSKLRELGAVNIERGLTAVVPMGFSIGRVLVFT